VTAILSDKIRHIMSRDAVVQRLIVTPMLDPKRQIGPGTIDLRLGTEFIETSRKNIVVVDPLATDEDSSLRPEPDRTYVPLGGSYVLHPGQFILGSTLEFISLPPDVVGQVLSRSSWGRLGLLVATAVVVQPGYRGVLTLELVNTGDVPLRLAPGLRVAQLQLWLADSPTSEPYGAAGKYHAPLGPQSDRLAWEWDELSKLRSIASRLHGQTLT